MGTYGNLQALRYVALNLPATLVQFLPVAALIGSLRAMGTLARGSELTVMRASGVPVWRIGLSVLLAGLLLVPLAIAAGEYLGPPMAQMARVSKAVQRNASISITSRNSAWIPDGAQILHAQRLAGNAGFGGITVFELAPGNRLASVGRAQGAHVTADGSWELEAYTQSRFEPQRVTSGSVATQRLNTSASPAFLGAIASDPKDLSRRELGSAIAHLERQWPGRPALPFCVLVEDGGPCGHSAGRAAGSAFRLRHPARRGGRWQGGGGSRLRAGLVPSCSGWWRAAPWYSH